MSIKGHRRRKLLRVLSDAPGAPMEGLPPSAQAVSCFPVVCPCCGDRRESPPLVPFLPLSETAPPQESPLCSCCRCRPLLSRADFPDPRFLTLQRPRTWGCLAPPPSVLLGAAPTSHDGSYRGFRSLVEADETSLPWTWRAGVWGVRVGSCGRAGRWRERQQAQSVFAGGGGEGEVWAPESWGLSPPCSQENPVIMACPLSPSACSQPASCSRAP